MSLMKLLGFPPSLTNLTLEALKNEYIDGDPNHINEQDEDGNTILHWACNCGSSSQIISYILENHANTSLKNKVGRTVLHTACKKGYSEIVDLLLDHNPSLCTVEDESGNLPLHWACFSGDRTTVQRLLNINSTVVNSQNKDGRTPLHTACKRSHLSLIFPLLRAGADRGKLDQIGNTPEQLSPQSDLIVSLYQEFDFFSDSLHNLKKNCDILETKLRDTESIMLGLENQVKALQEDLQSKETQLLNINRKLGIGIKETHVRLENYTQENFHADAGPLKGWFYDRRSELNIRCVVKMAYTDEELERLEKEKNLFDSIATRDPSTYIVRRLLWELIGPESIYNLDPTGEILPSPLAQKGLVLEAGGPNLMQYLKEYPHTPEIHRIQILEVIIRAVKYLHDAKFIHGDLKPENIVLFFSENDHTSRWKLVDFDNSFDLSSHTPPKLSQVTRYTKVYCPPELLRYSYNPSSDHDTVISFSFDIWSLGTLALFLLADTIFWSLVYPMSHSFEECWASFVRANPTDIQELINLKLKTRCGAKLRELLGKCFQLNPQSRSTAGEILLTKRLFGSGETTVNENLLRASESVKQGVDGINQLFSRFEALGTPVTCNELESKIEDLHHSFVNLIERMQINSQ